MKTKEEVIKDAWDNIDGSNKEIWASYWNYEKAKEHGMDESGGIFVKGYETHIGETTDYIRPKSLQGIENNNGWIRIEIEEDLPKDSWSYWVFRNDNLITTLRDYVADKNHLEDEINITHYQLIVKPKPPLY